MYYDSVEKSSFLLLSLEIIPHADMTTIDHDSLSQGPVVSNSRFRNSYYNITA